MKHDGLTISSSLSRKDGTWIFQSYDINEKKFELTEKAIAEIVFFAAKNFPSNRNLVTKLRNVILLAEAAKEQEELRDALENWDE